MNLLANLNSAEILEQLYHANQIEKIRNVVFMGMGEPLDNYDAVKNAVFMMNDPSKFSLSASHITISTVGVVPRIKDLCKDLPQIGLALSLHAPTQELRVQIVPTAKAWKLERIMEATEKFINMQNLNIKSVNRRKHVLVEYVMIKNVNDSEKTAHDLGRLLQNGDYLLNVIPYNHTDVPYDYESPCRETQAKFVDILRNEYDVHTLLRQELGGDIDSACGQLAIRNQKRECDNTPLVTDLEDLIFNGKNKKPKVVVRSKANGKMKIDIYTNPVSIFKSLLKNCTRDFIYLVAIFGLLTVLLLRLGFN
jgi:adenine C2-methylase RlmN of 23S rRNA A2503 and tRNA A37